MLLTITPEQFSQNNIFIQESTKNIVLTDGYFSRIVYSTPQYIMNGIFIEANIDGNVEIYFNKYKYTFIHTKLTVDTINTFCQIERDILALVSTSKTPQYKLQEQLQQGYVKFFSDSPPIASPSIVIKISGIWETETEFGISHKFIIN